MYRSQNNFGCLNGNKYRNLRSNSKFMKSLESDDCEDICDCCGFDTFELSDEEWNDISDSLDTYIDNNVVNFINNKYVKRIFKESFLENIFEYEKFNYSMNGVSIETTISNINSDDPLVKTIFSEGNKYDLKFSININFSDLEFTKIKCIKLTVNNKYYNKAEPLFYSNGMYKGSLKRVKNKLSVDLVYKDKNKVIVESRSLKDIIIANLYSTEEIDFKDYCENNEEILMYYFLADSKRIKDNTFNLEDVIKNKAAFEIFQIYCF